MKKILLLLLLMVVFTSCEEKPFTGYLVHKEYVKYHMSNESPKITYEASLFGIVVVPHVHRPSQKPKFVPSEWKFYVANKYGVRTFKVDSLTYLKYKCGTRMTFN